MGKISTKLEINIEIDVVYNNLKNRYNSERFKKASIDTKGYVPPIELIKNEVNSKLVFKAKGTDSLTKMKIGEWKWSYDFRDLGEKRTYILGKNNIIFLIY